MYRQQLRGSIAAVILSAIGSTALGAGVPPITSEGAAARAVVTALILRDDLQGTEYQFAYSTRDTIDRALRQLNATTTVAALLAAPAGIVVNCPVSGTLAARIANTWPRVLKIEWNDCVREEFSYQFVLDGPAEVVLLGNTLAPSMVPSIRLGDRNHDLVETNIPSPELPPGFGSDTLRRNLRVTGVLPMAREDKYSFFPGRYTFEVSGFYRYIQHIPDYSTGEPSVERYDHDHTVSTDGALMTGEFTSNTLTYLSDVRILWGKFSERYDIPATPTYPFANTIRKSVRGYDLRVQYGYDNDAQRNHISIDGGVEVDYNQFWSFNCSAPDVFTYRTRSRLTVAPNAFGNIFESGDIGINGGTTATFSATGTTQYVDLLSHVRLDVPNVGTFNHDGTDFIYNSSLFTAAICTP